MDPGLDILELRDLSRALDLAVDDQTGRREDSVGHDLFNIRDFFDVRGDVQLGESGIDPFSNLFTLRASHSENFDFHQILRIEVIFLNASMRRTRVRPAWP